MRPTCGPTDEFKGNDDCASVFITAEPSAYHVSSAQAHAVLDRLPDDLRPCLSIAVIACAVGPK